MQDKTSKLELAPPGTGKAPHGTGETGSEVSNRTSHSLHIILLTFCSKINHLMIILMLPITQKFSRFCNGGWGKTWLLKTKTLVPKGNRSPYNPYPPVPQPSTSQKCWVKNMHLSDPKGIGKYSKCFIYDFWTHEGNNRPMTVHMCVCYSRETAFQRKTIFC